MVYRLERSRPLWVVAYSRNVVLYDRSRKPAVGKDLRSPTVFTPDASIHAGAPVLPSVAINLTVASGTRSYKAADKIYLRNGVRQ